MDSIEISVNSQVKNGLAAMLEAAIGPNEIVQTFVSCNWALFIVAIAERATDKEEWFPHGKWATIQTIQGRIDRELDRLEWDEG